MLPLLLLAAGQSLAVVNDVPWAPFRGHVEKLIASAGKPLPAKTVQAVRALLKEKEPEGGAAAVQKLLDAHCLFGVHINPESRVKATRGARGLTLLSGYPELVLVKVHNEGGVTHPLAVNSEQAITPKSKSADRWVEVKMVDGKLGGGRVEYVVLRLTARQVGRREATFAFDVGQGTQDLGYRAEVPVLFQVIAGR